MPILEYKNQFYYNALDMFTNALISVKSYLAKLRHDKIYAYASSSAFFIVLSIFPFLILLLTLVQYTPLTREFLIDRIQFFFPTVIKDLFIGIINEIFSTTQGAVLILVSAVAGIWSASKGMFSIIRGINVCFNIDDKRNYFRVRLLSCIYTFIMIITILFLLVMLVFGSAIYRELKLGASPFFSFLVLILKNRFIISLIMLTLLFMIMYKFLPAQKKPKFLHMFPGAIIAALAIIGLSELVSLYVYYFPNFTYTYGTLTSFILFMLWLYFCMYILFLCAEINYYFSSWMEIKFVNRQRKRSIRFDKKLEKKEQKK